MNQNDESNKRSVGISSHTIDIARFILGGIHSAFPG